MINTASVYKMDVYYKARKFLIRMKPDQQFPATYSIECWSKRCNNSAESAILHELERFMNNHQHLDHHYAADQRIF